MSYKRKYRSNSKSQGEPRETKLQKIEKNSDSENGDGSDNLLSDADAILETLVIMAEKDMKEVERAIYPKREELLTIITQEIDQQAHTIKHHRQETLPSLETGISGMKDIRDKLHSILEDLEKDIFALRALSDQALQKEFEKLRSKETETLRKEVTTSFTFILIVKN